MANYTDNDTQKNLRFMRRNETKSRGKSDVRKGWATRSAGFVRYGWLETLVGLAQSITAGRALIAVKHKSTA